MRVTGLECGDIVETVNARSLQLDVRAAVKRREAGTFEGNSFDRKLLPQREIWLGGRDSNSERRDLLTW